MSPELFNYKPYSYKSDIWSLGCVFYEMCNLKHAFNAQTINALALKIMKGNFNPVTSTYSRELRDLIHSMLNVDAKLRPSIKQIVQLPFVKQAIASYMVRLMKTNPSLDTKIVETLKLQINKINLYSFIESSEIPSNLRVIVFDDIRDSEKIEELNFLKQTSELKLKNQINKKNDLEFELQSLKEIQSRIESPFDHQHKSESSKNSFCLKNKYNENISSSYSQPSEFQQSEFNDYIPNDTDEYDEFEFIEDIDENCEQIKDKISSKINLAQKKINKKSEQLENIQMKIEKLKKNRDSVKNQNFEDSFNDSKDLEDYMPLSSHVNKENQININDYKFTNFIKEKITQIELLTYKKTSPRTWQFFIQSGRDLAEQFL